LKASVRDCGLSALDMATILSGRRAGRAVECTVEGRSIGSGDEFLRNVKPLRQVLS